MMPHAAALESLRHAERQLDLVSHWGDAEDWQRRCRRDVEHIRAVVRILGAMRGELRLIGSR